MPYLPLALFSLLMLFLALFGLTASGHFPRASRLPAMAEGTGPFVLWVSIAVAACCLGAGLVAAWRLLPWYAAVIGGGGGVLVAPLILQWFPDRFVDGKRGLVCFAGAVTVLALALFCLMRQ